jgi:hypothetical protein
LSGSTPGYAFVSLAGSTFDTLMTVYTGGMGDRSLKLTEVASNDNCMSPSGTSVVTSCVSFPTVPNTNYSIQAG